MIAQPREMLSARYSTQPPQKHQNQRSPAQLRQMNLAFITIHQYYVVSALTDHSTGLTGAAP
jgi:hypothetical protein